MPTVEYEMPRKHKNLPDWTGRVFDRLTVLGCCGIERHGQRIWRCKCSCGKEVSCVGSALKSGNTRSCGCLHDEIRRARKGVKIPQISLGFGVAARNAVISCYKGRARDAGRVWALTNEEAEQIFKDNCHYCGKEPSHQCSAKKMNGGYTYNGIDRLDNSKGYEIGNVVPCCKRCNMAKNNMPYAEFRGWIERVYCWLNRQQEVPLAS